MQKIPTLFIRDMTTKLVTPLVTPGCEWVIDGEGVATEKIDGTCCMVRDGKLYKRYDAKQGRTPPEGFEPAQDTADEHTGHWPGWLLVGNGPGDQWHREAWRHNDGENLRDGTYELVGPKVQGNPYDLKVHHLAPHGGDTIEIRRLTFDTLRNYLDANDEIEGIVWHHPDGRKAKLKRRDFGLAWPVKEPA